jgi:hypothetical protein
MVRSDQPCRCSVADSSFAVPLGSVEDNASIDLPRGDYAFCIGETAQLTTNSPSGIFGINSRTTFGGIQDGSSNTILMGEVASRTGLPATST